MVCVNENNREMVTSFIKEHWFTTEMVIRGDIIDMTRAEGIIALDEKENISGLITYMIKDSVCEITSLDSLQENRGTGTALIQEMIRLAEDKGCEKLFWLSLTTISMPFVFIRKEASIWFVFIAMPWINHGA